MNIIPITFTKKDFKEIDILISDFITLARMILPVRDYIDSDLSKRLAVIENDLKFFAKTQRLSFPTIDFINSVKYVHPPGLSIYVILAVLTAHTVNLEDDICNHTLYLSTSRFPHHFFKSLL
jgi:hypothetical protein